MRHATRAAITMALGDAIFVGLPLVAWGVGDLRGFLAGPPRLGYVVLALALNGYAAIRIPEVGKRRGDATRLVRRQRLAVRALQVIPLALVVVAPLCDRRGLASIGGPIAVRYLGVAAYAAGFLLMHWTEAHLGRLFSVQVEIQPGHRLVTDGPYRRLRHPRYLGIIVWAAGIALVFRSWVGLALVAAITLVLLWRIHDEEALMRSEFGAEWSAYAARSWRLVPLVY